MYTWKISIEILRLDSLSHTKEEKSEKRIEREVFFFLFFWFDISFERNYDEKENFIVYGRSSIDWRRRLHYLFSSFFVFYFFFFFILTTDNNRDEELLVCCRSFFLLHRLSLTMLARSLDSRDFLLHCILDIFIILFLIHHQTNFFSSSSHWHLIKQVLFSLFLVDWIYKDF